MVSWVLSSRMAADLVCQTLIVGLSQRKMLERLLVNSCPGRRYCAASYLFSLRNTLWFAIIALKGNAPIMWYDEIFSTPLPLI